MIYVICAEDAPNTLALRMQNRASHLARLQQLKDQQRLILAGPHPIDEADNTAGFSGSTIIAEFENLAEARCWAEADPYLIAGVYQAVNIKPFNRVF